MTADEDDIMNLLQDRIAENDLEAIRTVLDEGLDVNALLDNCTLLLLACGYGREEIVHHLLDRGADIALTDSIGTTPLLRAAYGHTATVALLLDRGANIDQGNKLGYNPLMLAAAQGFSETLELLLKRGANVNQTSEEDLSPLHYAVTASPLSYPASYAVLLLLRMGADPNIKNRYGTTPLMNAAFRGNKEMLHALLKHGADPNVTNARGETALSLASERNHTEIVSLLKPVTRISHPPPPLPVQEAKPTYSKRADEAIIPNRIELPDDGLLSRLLSQIPTYRAKHRQFRKAKFISVWLGNFRDQDDFDYYMDEGFAEDFGFKIDPPAGPETDVNKTPQDIHSLLRGFSWGTGFVDTASSAASQLGWQQATTAIVFYNLVYEPTYMQVQSGAPIAFIGVFPYSANKT